MRQKTKINKQCYHCTKCRWMNLPKKGLALACTQEGAHFPDCFEKNDWRDAILLDIENPNIKQQYVVTEKELQEVAALTIEERRKRVEMENPHIVQIRAEIQKEQMIKKRAQQIYDHIMSTGGIDGYTLIKRA